MCLCSSIETSACITWGPCIERRAGAEGGSGGRGCAAAGPPRSAGPRPARPPPARGAAAPSSATALLAPHPQPPGAGALPLGSGAAAALRREPGKASALGGCEFFRGRSVSGAAVAKGNAPRGRADIGGAVLLDLLRGHACV